MSLFNNDTHVTGCTETVHGLFLCEIFLGSDDEDARKSVVGRRELSQVRLKEVNHSYDLDVLSLAVTIISQKKLKVACGAFSALQHCRPIVPLPPVSSPHSSPEAPCTT